MKLIVAGSRKMNIDKRILDYVIREMEVHGKITEIVSGHSGRIDLAGEEWARENGIPVKLFPADWEKYKTPSDPQGKKAGPIRNAEMAKYADAGVILTWVEGSKGAMNMWENLMKFDRERMLYDLADLQEIAKKLGA